MRRLDPLQRIRVAHHVLLAILAHPQHRRVALLLLARGDDVVAAAGHRDFVAIDQDVGIATALAIDVDHVRAGVAGRLRGCGRRGRGHLGYGRDCRCRRRRRRRHGVRTGGGDGAWGDGGTRLRRRGGGRDGDRRDGRGGGNGGRRGDGGTGRDLVRHGAQQDQADGQGQRAGAQGGSGVLQHQQSPLEDAERGGSAGECRRRCGGNAQLHQQASVVVGGVLFVLQHGGIAGDFAGEGVFAGGQVRDRMEEEQVLRERRHPRPPEVAALQVRQFVVQGHAQVVVAHRGEGGGRQHQHRTPGPGQHRRVDRVADPQLWCRNDAEPLRQRAVQRLHAAVATGTCVPHQSMQVPGVAQRVRQHHRDARQPGGEQQDAGVEPRCLRRRHRSGRHRGHCVCRWLGSHRQHDRRGDGLGRQQGQRHRCVPNQADHHLRGDQPPQPGPGARIQSRQVATQRPHQGGEQKRLQPDGEQPRQQAIGQCDEIHVSPPSAWTAGWRPALPVRPVRRR